jgi:signal transduction histidine kinase
VRLFEAHGVRGAYLHVHLPTLPELRLAHGSLGRAPRERHRQGLSHFNLGSSEVGVELGNLWLDGGAPGVDLAARAVDLALDAAWSRAEARESGRRLAALDAAVRGIAGVLSVDRVLQLIVDRVRELVSAQYAALGIVGEFDVIDPFITSGISLEHRRRIGDLPRGRGLLGLIIREEESFRIDDITNDPRRYGFPPHHPLMRSFLGVPVRSKGRTIGNLYLTNKTTAAAFSEADQRLVEMFALHAGIAIENARLHEEVERLAILEERDRIGQDLHDSIIQSLYAVALSLEDLPEVIAEEPTEGLIRLDRGIDAIHQTIRDIRNFIRGLRPELLDEADLAAGIHSLAAEFQLNTLIDLELQMADPLPELAPSTAAHLLAMTREGLSNIARHSAATRASLELGVEDGTLRLIIGDNGRGFDLGEAHRRDQHGLANLRSRAESMGGSLIVHSELTVGTRIEVRIPSHASAETDERGKAADGE